ncbi:HK97 family phage prohead protease [Rhizobium laguerreae]|uniref:HK97 family phage prohead protease n=1 Tax=Rhizobium laguerreae TaxID=1076926 RepID=UPI001C90E2AE|nr:HK97 family phage prohead protease [Rhizobium laguerreae]MBY3119942.1 HK97 family phage prohead protease [Rhizobium laguerreae]
MTSTFENKRAALFSSAFEFKFSAGAKAGTFSGYGAVFGNVDSHGDVIEKGAFAKNLRDWQARDRLPKMLLQHGGMFGPTDDMLPIGQWTSMEEDSKGLKVEGRLFGLETDRGALIYEGLTSGELDGLSIGYRAKKFTMGSKTGDARRRLHEVDLAEVSIVTWGSNDQALISSVKGHFDIRDVKTAKDFERMLMSLGFAQKFAQRATAAGFKAADTIRISPNSDRSGLASKLRAAAEKLSRKD